jgi:hypothetical protein
MDREKLDYFLDNYFEMTNGQIFEFISEYGEVSFFVDLWSFLDFPSWKSWYADIAHSYFATRRYFETH